MFDIIRQDFARYRQDEGEGRGAAVRAAFAYGFIAVVLYRYGRWTRRIGPRPLRLPFALLYHVLRVPTELLLGIDISANADIGPGLYIGHFGGVFLHCDAGRNLSVGQGVTCGFKGAGKSGRWPRLGNDVYIGAGGKVIGEIHVGDGVVIGANTVVTRDVPPYMRVVGAAVRMSPLGRVPRKDLPVSGQSSARAVDEA